MGFLGSMALLAALVPFYFDWSRAQADAQLDKMQEAAFNTPGAEAPIPISVALSLLALVVGHFAIGKRLFGLAAWQSVFTLILGITGGIVAIILRFNGKTHGENYG